MHGYQRTGAVELLAALFVLIVLSYLVLAPVAANELAPMMQSASSADRCVKAVSADRCCQDQYIAINSAWHPLYTFLRLPANLGSYRKACECGIPEYTQEIRFSQQRCRIDRVYPAALEAITATCDVAAQQVAVTLLNPGDHAYNGSIRVRMHEQETDTAYYEDSIRVDQGIAPHGRWQLTMPLGNETNSMREGEAYRISFAWNGSTPQNISKTCIAR